MINLGTRPLREERLRIEAEDQMNGIEAFPADERGTYPAFHPSRPGSQPGGFSNHDSLTPPRVFLT